MERDEILSDTWKRRGSTDDSDRWDETLTPVRGLELATLTPEATNLQGVINPAIFPLLKAVCQNKESMQARHTGIEFVLQIAAVMAPAVVPHLRSFVEVIEFGLDDDDEDVRIITAQSLVALAEASAMHGFINFELVLNPLLNGIRSQGLNIRGASLKAMVDIIPLMDAIQASYYTKVVMDIVMPGFGASNDDEVNWIMLKLIHQCVSKEGVEAVYIQRNIMPDLFRRFWDESTAYSHRSYKQVVETTAAIAKKVGVATVVGIIVDGLKDKCAQVRMMVMETIGKIIADLGATDIDAPLAEILINDTIYAFKEQFIEVRLVNDVMLDGFGAVVNSLGPKVKPYLPRICHTIECCLNHIYCAKARQQAAILISRISVVLKQCQGEELMGDLGVVLYENLTEECPEVLGSMLGALKAIFVSVSDAETMTPPIKNLLPLLTRILKNQHEKEVQKNCVELVCLLADML